MQFSELVESISFISNLSLAATSYPGGTPPLPVCEGILLQNHLMLAAITCLSLSRSLDYLAGSFAILSALGYTGFLENHS